MSSLLAHLFVDELEVEVAAPAVGVRLSPGLQLVPAVLCASEVLGVGRGDLNNGGLISNV
jgi:hypothetical protein